MVKLIADQRQLLKLAFGLSVDLDFLMENIKSNPQKLDENSRSQFLEGIFIFLREAIGVTEASNYLLTIGKKRAATSELVRPTRVQAPPALRRVPTPIIPMGRKPGHNRRQKAPRKMAIPTQSPLSKDDFGKKRCFLVLGVPFLTTPVQVLEHIYGGALERLVRKPYKDSQGCNFCINFVEPEAAAKFWSFINTSEGRLAFPGRSTEICQRPGDERVDIMSAAKDPKNPARRVLAFCNIKYPATQEKFRDRLLALDKRFFHCYTVDAYHILPDEKKLFVMFDCIGAAVIVMKFHKSRLLGDEFNGCSVGFGCDPADRPIPMEGNTVKPKSPTGNEALEAFFTAPAPPKGTPIFYQSTSTPRSKFIPSTVTDLTTQEMAMEICQIPLSPKSSKIYWPRNFLPPATPIINVQPSTPSSFPNTSFTANPYPTLEVRLASPVTKIPEPMVDKLSNVYHFGKFN